MWRLRRFFFFFFAEWGDLPSEKDLFFCSIQISGLLAPMWNRQILHVPKASLDHDSIHYKNVCISQRAVYPTWEFITDTPSFLWQIKRRKVFQGRKPRVFSNIVLFLLSHCKKYCKVYLACMYFLKKGVIKMCTKMRYFI